MVERGGGPRPETRDDVVHAIEDADALGDLGTEVPRELLEAALGELVNPADETDEG